MKKPTIIIVSDLEMKLLEREIIHAKLPLIAKPLTKREEKLVDQLIESANELAVTFDHSSIRHPSVQTPPRTSSHEVQSHLRYCHNTKGRCLSWPHFTTETFVPFERIMSKRNFFKKGRFFMSDTKKPRWSKRQIYPILTWAAIVLTIVISIATPVWQSVSLWSNELFRLSFLGNWAATMLGAFVGIPIALILEKWRQSEQDAADKERQEKERTEREMFVLSSISDELHTNRQILEQLIEAQKQTPKIVVAIGMKDVNWKVLSDSGQIAGVRDLKVLGEVAYAYYYIGALIHYEKQYANPLFKMPITKNGEASFAGAETVETVNKMRPDALEAINGAIKMIEQKRHIHG